MMRIQQVDVVKELTLVKSTLRALLSGREDRLDSRAWTATIDAVFALCIMSPSRLPQLRQLTSDILRRHLNSVRDGILGIATVAPGHATAAPDHATAALNNLTLALSVSDTQPDANREAIKGLIERYAKEWATFIKNVKNMEHIYVHFNQKLRDKQTDQTRKLYKKKNKREESKKDVYTASSVTYNSWPTELKEYALHKWLECVMLPAEEALRGAVMGALHAECEGHPLVEGAVLKSVIDSFLDVREYDTIDKAALHREWVVQPYLTTARLQHAERARALLAEGDLSHFMRHMLAVNMHELVTLFSYFGRPVSREAQINFLEVAVIPHVGELKAAAPSIVSAAARGSSPTARDDLRDLHLLGRLLHELVLPEPLQALPKSLQALPEPLQALPEPMQALVDAAHAHIVADGRAMLHKRSNSIEAHEHFVHTILRLRFEYCKFFVEVFEGDRLFCVDVLNKAWRAVLNSDITEAAAEGGGGGSGRTRRAPELLARFYDMLLRRRGDPDVEIRLATIAPIFIYLGDKDLFQEHYQKMLAKRLLNRTSSMKLEETTINSFRVAGIEFNGKLRAMYKDIATSFALNEKFREWTEEKRLSLLWGGNEDCRQNSVQVLQGWAWPLANVPTPWVAPAPLERYTRKFEAFYKERHPRRRLTWLHELCTGELTLRYAARPYQLTATSAQCGLLLAFQERDRWGAEELREQLRLPRADWVKQLQPLLKLRLLLAAGDVLGGDASGEDMQGGNARGTTTCATLTLNLDFSHEQINIKITCSKVSAKQPAPSPEAQAPAPSRRELRCKAYTQALLMRIMKKHKVLHHDEVLQEMEAQSDGWFSPTPELVKTYIDELVFKEYLEVSSDGRTYKYLP